MKISKNLVRCEKGHFYDANTYVSCPHCRNNKEICMTELYTPPIKRRGDINPQPEPITESRNEETQPDVQNEIVDIYGSESKQPDTVQEQEEEIEIEPEEITEGTTVSPEALDEPPVRELRSDSDENPVTIGFFGRTIGTDPVVGWLVCTKGPHIGEDFRIKTGRNFIGRSVGMHICLSSDKTVSRDRHAILTYDPKNAVFLIQPGNSEKLIYVNDKLVLVPTELKLSDKILLGGCELTFVPFCSNEFNW